MVFLRIHNIRNHYQLLIWRLSKTPVILSRLPFYHCTGINVSLVSGGLLGIEQAFIIIVP